MSRTDIDTESNRRVTSTCPSSTCHTLPVQSVSSFVKSLGTQFRRYPSPHALLSDGTQTIVTVRALTPDPRTDRVTKR